MDHNQNIFSQETMEILQVQSNEEAFQLNHRTKRYTVAKDEWDKLQKEHVIPSINSKFYPEYGVLFNDHGYLLPGLKETYLFVAVEIPKDWHIKIIELDFPYCDEWAGRNLCNWQSHQRDIPAIKELIHQQVCADVNRQFQELKTDIDDKWRNLTFQVMQQIPAFVPNKILHTSYCDAVKLPNGELWYSIHKPHRMKRVTPAVFLAAANAIGGLVLKGIDIYSNYKWNNSMDSAVKVLIKNNRRFHERMLRMEDNVGVITRTTVTGFEQINDGFNKLNRSVQVGFYRVDSMLNQTEQKFHETHDTLNNHHLAIHYLSKSVGVVLPTIRKYRSTLQKYRLAIKGFIDGLDEMSTGRLCYELLDPIQLSKYLRTIQKDLTDSHSDYTLVFEHRYQY